MHSRWNSEKNSIDNHIGNITQIIVETSKTDRQLRHMTLSNTNYREETT